MGLFDFLKKGPAPEEHNINNQVIPLLKAELTALHHPVVYSDQDAALIINDVIKIKPAIINITPHPNASVLQLQVITIHKDYFPQGIEVNLAGIGTDVNDSLGSAISNYITTVFPVIIDSLSDSHYPEADFFSETGGREILWHPKLGDLFTQGQWESIPEGEAFFTLLQNDVKDKLMDQKLNWLKVYVARMPNGGIITECLLNNEVWEEGVEILRDSVQTWPQTPAFLGIKQFMMFRRCDAYDVV